MNFQDILSQINWFYVLIFMIGWFLGRGNRVKYAVSQMDTYEFSVEQENQYLKTRNDQLYVDLKAALKSNINDLGYLLEQRLENRYNRCENSNTATSGESSSVGGNLGKTDTNC